MSKEIIKRINDRKAKKGNEALPPILDEDPVLAAEFLSIADSEHYFEVMLELYENLGSKEQVHIALEELVLDNEVNFDWFKTFTVALGQLVNEGKEFFIPKDNLEFRTGSEELILIPPLTGVTVLKPIKAKAKDNNIITLNRILYIKEGYSLTDFREGFPAWYAFSKVTLFEKYNPKTNKRVKITFEKGSFCYYLAGASDHWMKIVGIPLEMDSVISALLFRE